MASPRFAYFHTTDIGTAVYCGAERYILFDRAMNNDGKCYVLLRKRVPGEGMVHTWMCKEAWTDAAPTLDPTGV